MQAPECPSLSPLRGSGQSRIPAWGRGRHSVTGWGQAVTPAAANTGSLSASHPANTSPVVAARCARGAGWRAAAGLGQRLLLAEPSTGPLCGGAEPDARGAKPLCMLWVTRYDMAWSHRSLAQCEVCRDLVPAALFVFGAEQSQEKQAAASLFSISPQPHVSSPFLACTVTERYLECSAAQEHLWLLFCLPEGCRAGFEHLQDPSGGGERWCCSS